jgi:SAM-dependent methyltransferase
METIENEVDSPERIYALRETIQRKVFLRNFYEEAYSYFKSQVSAAAMATPLPKLVELGAGPSFLKDYIPHVQYTDLIPYSGLDLELNALAMPFEDNTIDGFFLLNVIHHIPDGEQLFAEITRTLKPGGFVSMVDQNVNWFSKVILQYLHSEPFDDAKDWRFDSEGPLSSANGALAWILFKRDWSRFQEKFPGLQLVDRETAMPFQYWLSGGLRFPQLLPSRSLKLVKTLDRAFLKLHPNAGSFLRVTLRKISR